MATQLRNLFGNARERNVQLGVTGCQPTCTGLAMHASPDSCAGQGCAGAPNRHQFGTGGVLGVLGVPLRCCRPGVQGPVT
jgi:hypothetical protein